MDNNLCDNFGNGIAQPNWPKITNMGRNIRFWNQAEVRVVNVRWDETFHNTFIHKISDGVLKIIPKMLVKYGQIDHMSQGI